MSFRYHRFIRLQSIVLFALCATPIVSHARFKPHYKQGGSGAGTVTLPGQPPLPGSVVSGLAASSLLIATPDIVNSAAKWQSATTTKSINSQVLKVGRALTDVGQKQTASMSKLFEAQNALIKQAIKKLGQNQAREHAMRNFGPRSRSITGCGAPDSARAAASTGAGAAIRVEKTGIETSARRNLYLTSRGNSQALTRVIKTLSASKKPAANSVFGDPASGLTPSCTGSACAKKQAASVGLITDPRPAPVPNASAKKTGEGEKYDQARQVLAAQLSLPERTLASIQSAHTPTTVAPPSLKASWAKNKWSKTPLWDTQGRVSTDSFLKSQMLQRYANPAWKINVQANLNSVGVLREVAQGQAVQLAYAQRQTELLEQIAGLLAQMSADRIHEKSDPVLNQMIGDLSQHGLMNTTADEEADQSAGNSSTNRTTTGGQ